MRPLFLALASLLSTTAAADAPNYAVTGSIAGPDGSWDYARVDPAARRLYVARADGVTTIDLSTGKLVGTIGSASRGHAAVPLDGGRLLVTSGNDATVRFFDAKSGATLASIAVGKKPDAAILSADGRTAFVMNADSGSVSEIDTIAMKVTRTIPVKPALEYGALAGTTLYINDEDANEIETVDTVRGTVGDPIAMPGCEGPTGLAYDAPHGRLISACANGKAAIVDVHAGRMTALVDIGEGADAVLLDPARQLAFIPCGKSGVLDILSLSDSAVTRTGRVVTERGARTGALDPATGTIYLPTARFSPAPAGGRPSAIPGSFHILVVKPQRG
jgi:YVTN family beta-propeller protein